MFRKLIAEFIGTGTLVAIGCGTAMLTGCEQYAGYLITALAFGLAIVAMAYSIGDVSGCHINPAVSLAMWISGKMTLKEMIGYIIAQCVGGFVGSAITWAVIRYGGLEDKTGAFGANGLAGVGGNVWIGLGVEVLLTFVFVLAILFVTSNEKHEAVAGLVIAFTLVLVHLIGIGLTGTSVNPARSFGPALTAMLTGNIQPMSIMWVFTVGPMFGGFLASAVFVGFNRKKALEKA